MNICNIDGDTVLYVACNSLNDTLVRNLLSCPTIQLDRGVERLPLHVACVHGDMDIVQALIKAGANVNAVSTYI